MTEINSALQEAGYAYVCTSEAGKRYVRDGWTVYHSGHMLIFVRKGGMTRSFSEDRLRYFTVGDMEKQVDIRPSGMFYREERNSYDITKRI